MPELPEVETMRRIIERELVGRRLVSYDLTLPKLLRDSPIPTLDPLVNQTILAARRRAKVLMIDWSDDLTLMGHMKLAGQIAVFRPDGERAVAGHPTPKIEGTYPHKTTHLTMRFDDASLLYLSDVRQFAWLRLMPTEDTADAIAAFDFGPEGVGAQSIDERDLGQRLSRRRIPIKTALLDQGVVAGLGNIYVDEALHASHLHPLRPANSLKPAELALLHEKIGWALNEGIKIGGAKIINQKAYPIDNFPAVHGREGEPCFTCGATIEKTRVGARGTYYCPVCQPAPATA